MSITASFNYADPSAPHAFPTRSKAVRVLVADGRATRQHAIVSPEARLMPALDQTGFALVKLPPPVPASRLFDVDTVEDTYMPAMEEYMKTATGCDEIMSINFVHRRSGKSTALPTGFSQNVPAARLGDAAPEERREDADEHFTGAISNVHADYADEARLIKFMRRQVESRGQDAAGRPAGRIRFVLFNCWRPLVTAQRWPLAVCDATSIDDSTDLYARETPENNNTVSNCLPSRAMAGKHRWVYFSNQRSDEVLIFKSWDEEVGVRGGVGRSCADRGVARMTLHSAFDAAAPPEAPVRQSLEARFACFWYDDAGGGDAGGKGATSKL